jgi:hypothetical protein
MIRESSLLRVDELIGVAVRCMSDPGQMSKTSPLTP